MSHVFKHPKYYKELQASLKKEAISPDESTDSDGRAPRLTGGVPGDADITVASDKQQASSGTGPGAELQATSVKRQAVPGAGCKRQAPSTKGQAPSHKRQAP